MADPSPSPLHLSSAPAFAATYRWPHTSSLSSPQAIRSTQRARPLPPPPPPLPPAPDRIGSASAFLPHAPHIGRRFDEDERKALAAPITPSTRLRLPRPPPVLTLSAPSRPPMEPPLPTPSSSFGYAPIAWGLN
ncbi:hypothetical protein MUK42_33238 [Musa troglodytarum]|uniref:Uncharacterized protein n=1 Tax=Musa troglodytarum TaxID=320322 RepID=A0A9E7F5P6_9LILI|nr:hypothetical protein MUK42_33238 [Musa troglodytarum]